MKAYFQRIFDGSKLWERIFWAVIRLAMVYAFVAGFFKTPFDITDPLQVGANLVCMFAWEIFMALPSKNLLRQMPSYVQDILIVLIFAASFGGKFMNFYYSVRFWDSALHAICGGVTVVLGYEVAVCMQKRDKKVAPLPIVLLCAFGFSFFVSTMWELFEFSFDQISLMGGGIGDSQHWCRELAEGTAKIATLIDPIRDDRWPIMDTMGDIVLNTIGAFVGYIALKIYPYHHKGKCDVNALLAEAENN